MGFDRGAAIDVLNQIVEHELAGMVRYTQYSLMVFGHARIPIIGWMQQQAGEAMAHARQAGEEVTNLGGRVSLGIGQLVGTHHDGVDQILEELVTHEESGIQHYRSLLELSEGADVAIEEFARSMIQAETRHVSEIKKMLRKRGDA